MIGDVFDRIEEISMLVVILHPKLTRLLLTQYTVRDIELTLNLCSLIKIRFIRFIMFCKEDIRFYSFYSSSYYWYLRMLCSPIYTLIRIIIIVHYDLCQCGRVQMICREKLILFWPWNVLNSNIYLIHHVHFFNFVFSVDLEYRTPRPLHQSVCVLFCDDLSIPHFILALHVSFVSIRCTPAMTFVLTVFVFHCTKHSILSNFVLENVRLNARTVYLFVMA